MSRAHNSAYVAAALIPPAPPPASEVGVRRWMRVNLFNGVISSMLTLVCVALVLLLVLPFIEWAILMAVWNAGSLDECREIIVATHGEGARGACWAVFNGRVGQFLFGLYPPELYWRPVLALVLLAIALAPILGRAVPRQLLWFSAIYPVIAFVLIWGGFGLEQVSSDTIGGFLLTIIITVPGVCLAFLIGLSLALARRSSMMSIRVYCAAIIGFFRGVPKIVLLYSGVVLLTYFLPPGGKIDVIFWGMVVLALHAGTSMAEAILDGFAGLSPGQREAARALGFSDRRAFGLIILPQVLRTATPRLVRASAGLFRDTTLVLVLGLYDPVMLIALVRADGNWGGVVLELFVVVALIYGAFCFAISSYAGYFERKLRARNCCPSRQG